MSRIQIVRDEAVHGQRPILTALLNESEVALAYPIEGCDDYAVAWPLEKDTSLERIYSVILWFAKRLAYDVDAAQLLVYLEGESKSKIFETTGNGSDITAYLDELTEGFERLPNVATLFVGGFAFEVAFSTGSKCPTRFAVSCNPREFWGMATVFSPFHRERKIRGDRILSRHILKHLADQTTISVEEHAAHNNFEWTDY